MCIMFASVILYIRPVVDIFFANSFSREKLYTLYNIGSSSSLELHVVHVVLKLFSSCGCELTDSQTKKHAS